MNQAGAVCFALATTVVLAFLWVREVHRERQLRAVQGERIMKNLREALLRENGPRRERWRSEQSPNYSRPWCARCPAFAWSRALAGAFLATPLRKPKVVADGWAFIFFFRSSCLTSERPEAPVWRSLRGQVVR